MNEQDQEKIAFITDGGVHCYTTMPVELKNARTTYQCLVNHIFYVQIECNIEAYMDDILIKSKTFDVFLPDLQKYLGYCKKLG